jgi:hypothetical protein
MARLPRGDGCVFEATRGWPNMEFTEASPIVVGHGSGF